MSANCEANRRFFEDVKPYLQRSWLKSDKSNFNSSSVAVTSNGKYFSGILESKTHLLDISSEQAALSLAVNSQDPKVEKVISVIDGEFIVNPIVLKVLVDHFRRTGVSMEYTIYNLKGDVIFNKDNVYDGEYKPPVNILDKIKSWSPKPNKRNYDFSRSIEDQLFECAKKGMKTHFSSNTKTLYGASVLANEIIYYGGVYSSFDHRMNLHSEMVSAVSAIADGNPNISYIGLVSTKFRDTIPQMCGCCRQFFSEIQSKTKQPITFLGFNLDGDKMERISLDEYLPSPWDSSQPSNNYCNTN